MTEIGADSKPASPVNWETSLDEHGRWIRTVIFSRVRVASAVEEIFQEVALAAIRHQPDLQDVSQISAWLYRVAVRQSLLFRRKQGRHRRKLDAYGERLRDHSGEAVDASPMGWLLADERRELIRQTLKRLPDREVEILMLKYTEDWSYREMAERLGTTESAVQARLHRARNRLRLLISQAGLTEVLS